MYPLFLRLSWATPRKALCFWSLKANFAYFVPSIICTQLRRWEGWLVTVFGWRCLFLVRDRGFPWRNSPRWLGQRGLFVLHDAVGQHRIRDFDKPGNIGAFDIVNIRTFLAVIGTLLVNTFHDFL